ncbi:PREDICTED: uncharacterized protein LOC105556211 [Vollenhovia emeryi]|uniref:uncharacterized protein LOC105556211 n=1 Tax=Vollenhovia emeryi TaxID=411798 RepID=UPI0005F44078|nr:PREDICTED: uncharacterized protein LOC105556211 [Vollenhovia emeryi]
MVLAGGWASPARTSSPLHALKGFRGSRASDYPGTVIVPPRSESRGRLGRRERLVLPSPCPPRRLACTLPPPGGGPARTREPSREPPGTGARRTPPRNTSERHRRPPRPSRLPPQARGERHPRPQQQPPASSPPDPDLRISPSGSERPQTAEPRLGNVRAASTVCHLVRTTSRHPHARMHALKRASPRDTGDTDPRCPRPDLHHCRPGPLTVRPPSDPHHVRLCRQGRTLPRCRDRTTSSPAAREPSSLLRHEQRWLTPLPPTTCRNTGVQWRSVAKMVQRRRQGLAPSYTSPGIPRSLPEHRRAMGPGKRQPGFLSANGLGSASTYLSRQPSPESPDSIPPPMN